MHRCLAIEEILRVIFHLWRGGSDDPNVSDEGQQSPLDTIGLRAPGLRACALTCRTFLEPALDELWQEQLGLGNLVKVLPEDVWEAYSDGQEVPFGQEAEHVLGIVYGRSSDQIDWTRFDYYAHRIKYLDVTGRKLSSATYYTLSPSIISVLRSRGRLVFPAIQELSWGLHGIRVETLPCLDIFRGPELKKLSVVTCSSNPLRWRESMPILKGVIVDDSIGIEDVSWLCPRLTHLSLRLHGTLTIMNILPRMLAPLQQLHTFALSYNGLPATRELLSTLAGLPTLRHLAVKVLLEGEASKDFWWYTNAVDVFDGTGLPLIDPRSPQSGPIALRDLQELELSGDSGSSCSKLLACLQLPALRKVSISVNEGLRLSNLISMVDTCRASESLTTFEFVPLPATFTSHEVFTISELEPLKMFTTLQRLELNQVAFSDLTDGTVEHLASDFPHLESLTLSVPLSDMYPPKVTLLGVAALAKGCPRLRTLDIPFDPTRPLHFDNSDRSCQNMTTTTVRRVFLDFNELQNPNVAATLLGRLQQVFPRLSLKNVEWYRRLDMY